MVMTNAEYRALQTHGATMLLSMRNGVQISNVLMANVSKKYARHGLTGVQDWARALGVAPPPHTPSFGNRALLEKRIFTHTLKLIAARTGVQAAKLFWTKYDEIGPTYIGHSKSELREMAIQRGVIGPDQNKSRDSLFHAVVADEAWRMARADTQSMKTIETNVKEWFKAWAKKINQITKRKANNNTQQKNDRNRKRTRQ